MIGSGASTYKKVTQDTQENKLIQNYSNFKQYEKRNDKYENNFSVGTRELSKNETVTSTQISSQTPKCYDKIILPPKAYRNVYVSHVVSPSEFYCQIEEESSKLQQLMKQIEDVYSCINDNSLDFKELTIDAPCCAVFEEDGAWYRGQIKKVNSASCVIYFVDYGNTDQVLNSKIKVLQSNLLSLPPQAIKCKSFNVTPKYGKWNDSDINAFIDMTLDKSFVAQFVECDSDGTYSVNLVSIGKLQDDVLNKEFVSLGHGLLEDSSKILVLNSHAASSNLTFSSPEVPLGSYVDVQVTYGLNPGEIFCQLKSYEKEFMKMMQDLQNYYNKVSEAETLIDRPHQGMICAAQFFLDSAWYRAQIEKVEKNKIFVFYVDYGNLETVDRKKIRCITQDFTVLPTQAIRCHIKGIKPPGKSWKVDNSVSKYYEGKTECKFISKENDSYLIDIMCNKKNVTKLLIQDGLALPDGVLEQVVTAGKETKHSFANLPKREDFFPGQLISVIVSYTEGPSKFWCQVADESDILDKLMEDIKRYCESPSTSEDATFLVDTCCIAQYSDDENWYRAKVKKCFENEYEVEFIDYGNSEVVSASKVGFTRYFALI